VVTAEDLEGADAAYREIGKALGRESTMRELHAAVCTAADVDFDAGANYIHRLIDLLTQRLPMSNDAKDMVAVVVRHAMCVGVTAGRKDEARD
jgi:hypothetical protein